MSATVAPPRPPAGAPARSAPPPRAPATPPALLPVHVARLIGFVGVAMFGALQWAQMVRPAASDALLFSVVVAAIAGWLLSAVARREPANRSARVRAGATLLAAGGLLLVALVAAGVPLRLLGPRGWDDLAGGIGQGLGAVATVSTPYGGLDEWTRIVIVLGGCALTAVAALLAFAPRRRGAFGVPGAAAVALGLLYTVPVMQHDIRLPYVAGLLFVLLLATFLWLERLERRSAPAAVALVAVAALGGYVAAPSLDGDRALLDYEELAQSLSASTTTQYRWNHDYGPLDWPRDGREVLRVQARQRSYWKAVNLVNFDGTRWVQDTRESNDPLERTVFDPTWRQRIRVTLRALRSTQFVTAGSALEILDTPRTAIRTTPGVFETASEPLRRGHAYQALVYTPRPGTPQLRRAGSDYGTIVGREYGLLRLPPPAAGSGPGAAGPVRSRRDDGPVVLFAWWGEAGPPLDVSANATDARAAIKASPYARVYALAQRLREGTTTPFEYMRAIERYLASDAFSYSERPRPSRAPLAEFLLRDRVGYCQQFSGAMALLLRMGGVPARVASGFSPGALDEERGEYVVRDVDAHSWVEVFVPNVGWVVRDPTPAAAPARAQTADLATASGAAPVALGGSARGLERTPDAGFGALPAAAAQDEGTSPSLLVAIGLGALVLGAASLALVLRRRRRRPLAEQAGSLVDDELAELRRALRRSRRTAAPEMTLDALALRMAGTPAQGYVQALAAARYGYGERAPTRAERAALRHELGAGLGLGGRVRAWWALPPRPPGAGRRARGRRAPRPG